MTFRQFDAMAKYIDNNQIIDQINHCRFFNPRRIPDSFDIEKIGRWLKNGWNTEFLLRQTPNYFADEDIVYALQWAFPQAYYSAFALTNAFFTSKSYTCESHASVIKHFSEHISGGKYPEPITYWADGGFNSMSTYRVNRMSGETSLAYNPSDINLVKHQIAV